jgi:hypothetical protein
MDYRQMVLERLVVWLRLYNQLVGEGTEAEAGVREEMSGGDKDGREEPSAGTVVVELARMSRRLVVIASD